MKTTDTDITDTMTQAEQVGRLFNHDGQRWDMDDGRTLDGVCREVAGRPTYRDGHGTDVYRYDFADGSSIVVAGAGWDYGLDGGCYCWEGAQRGHSDDCTAD